MRKLVVLLVLLTLPVAAYAALAFKYNTPPTSNGIDTSVIDFINAATSKLDISIYAISHTGIVDAIIAAKNRGVAVRMVTETDNWNTECDRLVAAGITVTKDNAGGYGSGLMHNKFIIRDNNSVLTGGYNFTPAQTTDDKNSIITVTGIGADQLAGIYTTEFNQMFVDLKFGTKKIAATTDSCYVDGVNFRVYFSPKGKVTEKVIAAINTCNSNLWFNIFTFTDSGIADAIIGRHNLGYSVKGTFDRWQATGTYSKDEALENAGVPVHRDTMTGLLHDKTMAIDGGTTSDPIGIIGSFNFTGAANTTNDENILIIYNSTAANSIKSNCVSVYNTRSN